MASLSLLLAFVWMSLKFLSCKSSSDCDAFYRALPNAPNQDASKISGNISLAQKQLSVNILSYFVIAGDAYGHEVGGRIRLVEVNVFKSREKGNATQGRTVCEIQVEKGQTDFSASLPILNSLL
jgi:hypothetical protein